MSLPLIAAQINDKWSAELVQGCLKVINYSLKAVRLTHLLQTQEWLASNGLSVYLVAAL